MNKPTEFESLFIYGGFSLFRSQCELKVGGLFPPNHKAIERAPGNGREGQTDWSLWDTELSTNTWPFNV